MIKLFLPLLIALNIHADERIVALSPAVNEIVFALGSGDKIVGNTTYCEHPTASLAIEKVGGYFSPSLERIVSLNPSIVIMQENNYKINQKLKQMGINTKVIKIDKLKNIIVSISEIGEILNKPKEAKQIINSINKELQKLKNIISDKRILIVIGHNTSLVSRIFVAGQNLYFDDIINQSNNTNALQSTRKGQPMLNMENLIATNPDIVILLAHSMKEKGLTRGELINPWKELPINAAETNSIYIIDKPYAGVPSNRIIYFLQDFQGILHDYKKHN